MAGNGFFKSHFLFRTEAVYSSNILLFSLNHFILYCYNENKGGVFMDNQELSYEEAIRIIDEHQDVISIRMVKDLKDTGLSDIDIATILKSVDEKAKEVHQFYS